MEKLLRILVASLILIFSFSCRQTEKVKIGVLAPLSGAAEEGGKRALNGIKVAVEEINDSGGLLGKPIELIDEDSKGDPKTGAACVESLRFRHFSKIIIGDIFSSVTVSISSVTNADSIILMSPAASSPSLRSAGPYTFSVWPSDYYECLFLSNLLIDTFKIDTVAILYSLDEYGVGIYSTFKDIYQKQKGTLSSELGYNESSLNFKTQLAKLKEVGTKTIYIVGHYRDLGEILKQADEIGINADFFSVSAFEVPEIFTIAGKFTEGVKFISPYIDTTASQYLSFKDNFTHKFNSPPGTLEAHSYDAMKVIASAIKSTKSFKTIDIRNFLDTLSIFNGATGSFNFDSVGSPLKPLSLKIVKNGKFVNFFK